MATVTVYRSKSAVWAGRSFSISVDGTEVGTVRGSRRLTLDIPEGHHDFTARVGRSGSAALSAELTAAGLILAVRPVMPSDYGRGLLQGDHLQLVAVHEFGDQGLTFRELHRNRPPVGYRRLRGWERLLFGFAVLVAILGQVLRHAVGPGVGLAVGAPGDLVMAVLVARLFIYRSEKDAVQKRTE